MRSLLGNISIRWKVLLAPAFVTLALIGIGTHSVYTQRLNQAAVNALILGPIQQAENVSGFAMTAWAAQTKLNRLTATAANETDQKKITSLAVETSKALAAVSEGLTVLDGLRSGEDKFSENVDRLKPLLTTYLKQAKNVIEMADSDLDLIYVGNSKDIVMYEGAAKEITEADFNAALKYAQEVIQPIIAAQKELVAKAGKKKREITLNIVPDEILAEAKNLAGDRFVPALLTHGKLAREAAVKAIQDEVGKKLVEKFGAEKVTEFVIKDAFYYIQKEAVRKLILESGKRLDGRTFDVVRPISSEVGILPRAHGSAIFSRGETQAVTLATLGTGDDTQEFDSYTGGETEKKFILHYNFPNFSVGETGRISGPGRREIGHGALAERSIESMLPKDYPYAVRVTSEIMESNGSTSMASVCGGTLALMDAGVPMIRPVAGISVGICAEYSGEKISKYQLLTDIIGWEDHYCDMDCKIAGTEKGITGFQLDLKLKGIPFALMVETVEKARIARMHILAEMAKTLAAPRTELSKYAPRIEIVRINPEKIGALIGPGGKNIKRLVEESGCEINIEDDGTVNIFSVSSEGMKIAKDAITGMTAEAEIGKIYRGKVVTVKEFGAFVEFLPGKDGLVHISELANFRVKNTEDIVKVGDDITVKCLGVDEKGRVRLSRKAAMEDRDQEMAPKP